MDERFRRAGAWMRPARRPGKYKRFVAMLRKYPSGNRIIKHPIPLLDRLYFIIFIKNNYKDTTLILQPSMYNPHEIREKYP